MRQLLVVVLACLLSGCTRAYYRISADKETYSATNERDHDPRWDLPRISIDPSPLSRFYDPYNPDRPPMPPDDPAADRYMQYANGMRGYLKWHKNGDAPWIEDPFWIEALPWSEKHELDLTPERSVELALIHSRDYQSALEDLYFVALALTLNRFEFAVHWFLTNDTQYVHFGSGGFPTESNQLQTNSTFGFTQAFGAGGQLGVDLLNKFAFEFAGPYQQVVTSNIVIDFLQPILRHAGRDVRMEQLTQGERSLLYAVRTFARFRKTFTVGIYTDSYLALLGQLQAIRNQETNVARLEQSYRLQEALFAAGIVTTVDVDQVFVQLQQSKSQLLQQRTTYQNALDQFKISLGLPPKIPVTIDEAQLKPFQLSDPALDAQQDELELFAAQYRELEQAPPLPKLREGFEGLKKEHRRTEGFLDQVEEELRRWQAKLEAPGSSQEPTDRARSRAQTLAKKELPEQRAELAKFRRTIDRAAAGLAETTREGDWKTLQELIRQETDFSSQVFVMQTQVRVYLIELEPIEFTEKTAVEYALANRLDFMNRRGQVVDAWRQIQIKANDLEAGLDVHVNANIATDPFSTNPVDFAASASKYTVGLAFDGPLNRQAERNAYRTSQIVYERARRSFMLLDDTIQQTLRRLLRQLETDRLNFEIHREGLIAAARNVDAARGRLLIVATQDTAATLNVLNALSGLLASKNALIADWISYETNRIQLLLDTEALQLDARGLYLNERNASNRDSVPADELPAPRQLPAPGTSRPPADHVGPAKDAP